MCFSRVKLSSFAHGRVCVYVIHARVCFRAGYSNAILLCVRTVGEWGGGVGPKGSRKVFQRVNEYLWIIVRINRTAAATAASAALFRVSHKRRPAPPACPPSDDFAPVRASEGYRVTRAITVTRGSEWSGASRDERRVGPDAFYLGLDGEVLADGVVVVVVVIVFVRESRPQPGCRDKTWKKSALSSYRCLKNIKMNHRH